MEFDPALFSAIVRQIQKVDRVIINGDFWDSYLCQFDQFVESEWKKLFPYLKAKKTIYIFGNHDLEEELNEKTDLFSDQQLESYRFKSGKKHIVVAHGHQIGKEFQHRHPLLTKYLKFLYPLIHASESWRGPLGWIRVWYRESSIKRMWQEVQRDCMQLKGDADALIIGHIHKPKIDEQRQIYCPGASRYGNFRYVLIDQGKITLNESKY